jgi:hypothetical protein
VGNLGSGWGSLSVAPRRLDIIVARSAGTRALAARTRARRDAAHASRVRSVHAFASRPPQRERCRRTPTRSTRRPRVAGEVGPRVCRRTVDARAHSARYVRGPDPADEVTNAGPTPPALRVRAARLALTRSLSTLARGRSLSEPPRARATTRRACARPPRALARGRSRCRNHRGPRTRRACASTSARPRPVAVGTTATPRTSERVRILQEREHDGIPRRYRRRSRDGIPRRSCDGIPRHPTLCSISGGEAKNRLRFGSLKRW